MFSCIIEHVKVTLGFTPRDVSVMLYVQVWLGFVSA